MRKAVLLLIACLSLAIVGNAQTKRTTKPVRKAKTTTPVKEPIAPPSANGKFKLKDSGGFYNATDGNKYVIIAAPGKSVSEIKSSIISSLSSMYSNPNRVISTLGDNIINVNGYAQDAFAKPFAGNTQYFSFTYNIKIEIKDGKIKMDSPNFSNITRKEICRGYTIDTRYVEDYSMLGALELCDIVQQQSVAAIFNAHIDKIVAGLSSNSDW